MLLLQSWLLKSEIELGGLNFLETITMQNDVTKKHTLEEEHYNMMDQE